MKRGETRRSRLRSIVRSLLSWVYPLNITGVLCLSGYILLCCYLGFRLRQDLEAGIDKHTLAKHIASLFTCMCIPISFYLIYEHLSNFFQPKLQVQVIRIILIVPIFAVESSLSIYFVDYSFYFQVFREFYESYVIYSFMRFLLYYLGDSDKIVQSLETKPASIGVHKRPFCCLHSWSMGKQFLDGCKNGVLQYVVNRFVLTSVSLVLYIFGAYVEGDYTIDSPYLYITLINSFSQAYALYALFLFYYASSQEFEDIRPFEKFLSIKLIIFFSWWQGLLIGVLVNGSQVEGEFENSFHSLFRNTTNDIETTFARKINSGMSADQHATQHMADGIQDLLICMEMLFAAVAFTYSFPVADFMENERGNLHGSNGADRSGLLSNVPHSTPGAQIRRRGQPLSESKALTPGVLIQGGTLAAISRKNSNDSKSVGDIDEDFDDLSTEKGLQGPLQDLISGDICSDDITPLSSFDQVRFPSKLTYSPMLKTLSNSSLCSNSDSSGRSNQSSHSSSHDIKMSFRKERPHRKYKWRDKSSHSLYSKTKTGSKVTSGGIKQAGKSGTHSRLCNCCGSFLSYVHALIVSLSSLIYYLTSFFFVEDVYMDEDTRAFNVEQQSNLERYGVRRITPTIYYDYHYFHAPPINQQLQHSGKFSVFQAIYLTLTMADLKDDMVDLFTFALDNFIINPTQQLKFWLRNVSM